MGTKKRRTIKPSAIRSASRKGRIAYQDIDRPWILFKNEDAARDRIPFALFATEKDAMFFAQEYADKWGINIFVENAFE